jgi:hypothetical protein
MKKNIILITLLSVVTIVTAWQTNMFKFTQKNNVKVTAPVAAPKANDAVLNNIRAELSKVRDEYDALKNLEQTVSYTIYDVEKPSSPVEQTSMYYAKNSTGFYYQYGAQECLLQDSCLLTIDNDRKSMMLTPVNIEANKLKDPLNYYDTAFVNSCFKYEDRSNETEYIYYFQSDEEGQNSSEIHINKSSHYITKIEILKPMETNDEFGGKLYKTIVVPTVKSMNKASHFNKLTQSYFLEKSSQGIIPTQLYKDYKFQDLTHKK